MNGKVNLSLGDFTIAAKTRARSATDFETGSSGNLSGSTEVGKAPLRSEEDMDDPAPRRRTAESERKAQDRTAAQEDARNSLKNLKRARQREVKFFVNVALDQATKARLKRAADENDLKMATLMKAAIDVYLKENGY